MKLIPNWKSVAVKSYSIWVNRLGFSLFVVPEFIYQVSGFDFASPYLLGWIGVSLYILSEAMRYIPQGIDHDK